MVSGLNGGGELQEYGAQIDPDFFKKGFGQAAKPGIFIGSRG